MSYAMMDHAGWVEQNIAAHKSMCSRKPRNDCRKGLKGAPDKLNAFQRTCMHIIGIVGNGIYNAPISWETIEWGGDRFLRVTWSHDLSTFDGVALSRLVFLAHECRIRVSIGAANFRCIEILFHRRSASGGIAERHPDMAQMMETMRSYIPADAPVFCARDEMLAGDPA